MLTTEWADFEHPDGYIVRVNISFMMSTWSCIFGNGCPGCMKGNEATTCCAFGFSFEKDELPELKEKVAALEPEDWEYARHHRAHKLWWRKREDAGYNSATITETDQWRTPEETDEPTRCIFFNTGPEPGCAFHQHALRTGKRPIEAKPSTCWSAPLELDDSTEGVFVIDVMTNKTWGQGEWEPLDWWCTESPEAYHASTRPVWVAMADELVAHVGQEVYDDLAAYCYMRQPKGKNHRMIPVRAE